MALFQSRSRDREEIGGSDAATRALSVTVVDNDFLYRVYENLSWVYDFTFGPALHPGQAWRRFGGPVLLYRHFAALHCRRERAQRVQQYSNCTHP